MKIVLNESTQEMIPEILPVIPTMDVVVFPHMIVPLLVLDEKIIKGIDSVLQSSKKVLLLAAKNPVDQQGAIGTGDLYQIGTVASIMRLIKVPEGGVKVLVQGISKARTLDIITQEDSLYARIEPIAPEVSDLDSLSNSIKNIKNLADKMASSGYTFSPDFHLILARMEDPEKIADFIVSHLNLEVNQAQELLETTSQTILLAYDLSTASQRN